MQAFYLAQFGLPFSGMIIARYVVGSTLQTPEEFPALLKAIAQGSEIGKKAKSFIAQKWEDSQYGSVKLKKQKFVGWVEER